MSLALGDVIPPFRLEDMEGLPYGLDGSPATVIVFTCAGCEDSVAWQERVAEIADEFELLGAAFLAVNPVDPPATIRAWLEGSSWPMPYLLDGDQRVARAFGARTTADVFVLDGDSRLRFRGAPGDELREAIHRVLENEDVEIAETDPVGSAIEWRS